MIDAKYVDYFAGDPSFADAVGFWFLKFAGVSIGKIALDCNVDVQTVKDVFAGRLHYGSEAAARRAS